MLLIAMTAATLGPAAARDRDTVPAATPAGKPQSCITRHRISNSIVRSDDVIDFEMIDHKVYRNTLPGGCPGLGFQQAFSYSTSIDQLCSSDIITVLYTSPLRSGASCGLGQFQPVTLAPRVSKPH
ncbi:MAG: hypothetical protein B7Y45_12185 [Sphingomonas sp. 28-66-16]|nr:MAG: hypothetical protein B7Y45_12185 [Sphingomonas sp. 28-66-16]